MEIEAKWDFTRFLADTANKLDEAIIDNSQLKSLMIKHIEKIIREAQKYSDYLNEKYQEAEKKQLSDSKYQKPEGEDWYFYANHSINYHKFNCPSVYFTSNDLIHFWMKGEPKPDPLDYLSNIIEDGGGKPHQELKPDDYKCFLLSCIYDNQRMAAGQERIYFEPNDTKELKNRICRAVWQGLCRDRERVSGVMTWRNSAQTIKTILQQLLKTAGGGNAGNTTQPTSETVRNIQSMIIATGISLIMILLFVFLVYKIPKIPFVWLKNHPNSYGLQGSIIFLIPCLVIGLFKPQWRNWCWGTASFAFLVLIISLLSGRSSP